MEQFYTCEEVAERYKVKTRTVWEWIRKGKLSAIKLNEKSYRVSESDLKNFEATNKTR